MSGLIAREWASYRELVVPVDAPPLQAQECRRAFYAGANAAIGLIMRHASKGPDVTEADEQLMAGLAAELEQFVQAVDRGAA